MYQCLRAIYNEAYPRLCVVYALLVTLSTEAQGTVHSSGNSDTLVVCSHTLLVSMEGKTRPGTHEVLPSEKGV